MDAMPARRARHAHEEVRARDVARAHDQRRDRRLDVPREPVPRVVREEVQQRERDEQERHDHRPEARVAGKTWSSLVMTSVVSPTGDRGEFFRLRRRGRYGRFGERAPGLAALRHVPRVLQLRGDLPVPARWAAAPAGARPTASARARCRGRSSAGTAGERGPRRARRGARVPLRRRRAGLAVGLLPLPRRARRRAPARGARGDLHRRARAARRCAQFPWAFKPSRQLGVRAVPIEVEHQRAARLVPRGRVRQVRVGDPVADQEPVTCVIPGPPPHGRRAPRRAAAGRRRAAGLRAHGRCAYQSTFDYSSERPLTGRARAGAQCGDRGTARAKETAMAWQIDRDVLRDVLVRGGVPVHGVAGARRRLRPLQGDARLQRHRRRRRRHRRERADGRRGRRHAEGDDRRELAARRVHRRRPPPTSRPRSSAPCSAASSAGRWRRSGRWSARTSASSARRSRSARTGLRHSVRIGDAVDFEIEDVVPFGVGDGRAGAARRHLPSGRLRAHDRQGDALEHQRVRDRVRGQGRVLDVALRLGRLT